MVTQQQNLENLSFLKLCEAEPKLEKLYLEAIHYNTHQAGKHYCPITVWYAQFKPKLIHLVGWDYKGDKAILRGNVSYDTAYKAVYEALPGCPKLCRGCD